MKEILDRLRTSLCAIHYSSPRHKDLAWDLEKEDLGATCMIWSRTECECMPLDSTTSDPTGFWTGGVVLWYGEWKLYNIQYYIIEVLKFIELEDGIWRKVISSLVMGVNVRSLLFFCVVFTTTCQMSLLRLL